MSPLETLAASNHSKSPEAGWVVAREAGIPQTQNAGRRQDLDVFTPSRALILLCRGYIIYTYIAYNK